MGRIRSTRSYMHGRIQAGAVQLFGGVISSSVTCVPYVCLHSFSSEMFAMALRTVEIVWMRRFLPELGVTINGPTALNGDNSSVIAMSQPGACPSKSKMDATRVALIQAATRGGDHADIVANKVHTTLNLVNFMTKHSPPKEQENSVRVLQNTIHAVAAARPIEEMIRLAVELRKATR